MNTVVDQTPHERSAADVAAGLGLNTEVGLSPPDAQAHLERDGSNELETEIAIPAWRRFLAQFRHARKHA